jgi:hypothetical protein
MMVRTATMINKMKDRLGMEKWIKNQSQIPRITQMYLLVSKCNFLRKRFRI